MTNGEKLIKLIDDRIADYFYTSNILCQYPAKVISVINSDYANVKLAGYDTEFKLPIRTGLSLSANDSVMVVTKVNDFNNAIIFEKFK